MPPRCNPGHAGPVTPPPGYTPPDRPVAGNSIQGDIKATIEKEYLKDYENVVSDNATSDSKDSKPLKQWRDSTAENIWAMISATPRTGVFAHTTHPLIPEKQKERYGGNSSRVPQSPELCNEAAATQSTIVQRPNVVQPVSQHPTFSKKDAQKIIDTLLKLTFPGSGRKYFEDLKSSEIKEQARSLDGNKAANYQKMLKKNWDDLSVEEKQEWDEEAKQVSVSLDQAELKDAFSRFLAAIADSGRIGAFEGVMLYSFRDEEGALVSGCASGGTSRKVFYDTCVPFVKPEDAAKHFHANIFNLWTSWAEAALPEELVRKPWTCDDEGYPVFPPVDIDHVSLAELVTLTQDFFEATWKRGSDTELPWEELLKSPSDFYDHDKFVFPAPLHHPERMKCSQVFDLVEYLIKKKSFRFSQRSDKTVRADVDTNTTSDTPAGGPVIEAPPPSMTTTSTTSAATSAAASTSLVCNAPPAAAASVVVPGAARPIVPCSTPPPPSTTTTSTTSAAISAVSTSLACNDPAAAAPVVVPDGARPMTLCSTPPPPSTMTTSTTSAAISAASTSLVFNVTPTAAMAVLDAPYAARPMPPSIVISTPSPTAALVVDPKTIPEGATLSRDSIAVPELTVRGPMAGTFPTPMDTSVAAAAAADEGEGEGTTMAVVPTFPEPKEGPTTAPIAFVTPSDPAIQETPAESDTGVGCQSSPLSDIDTVLPPAPPPSNQLALIEAPVPAVKQPKPRKPKTGLEPTRRSTRNITGVTKDASSSAMSLDASIAVPDTPVAGPPPALDTTPVVPSATKKRGRPPRETLGAGGSMEEAIKEPPKKKKKN
ncbi:hypothetical protein BDP27DRAFT_1512352 [Rhodocollybia butyracea]|uniref:Uncharacterized protein n=1 Tax=Rhodocollybia butyracea TaxID=206335 RepID=A0A9P5PY29_9AGAR|nr:hypothetical protein BDP27DRAFT_1512352 [Rhodocollybia butyracea]